MTKQSVFAMAMAFLVFSCGADGDKCGTEKCQLSSSARTSKVEALVDDSIHKAAEKYAEQFKSEKEQQQAYEQYVSRATERADGRAAALQKYDFTYSTPIDDVTVFNPHSNGFAHKWGSFSGMNEALGAKQVR